MHSVMYTFLYNFKIMFNLDKAHMLIDEMVTNGYIVETNKNAAMAPLYILLEKTA